MAFAGRMAVSPGIACNTGVGLSVKPSGLVWDVLEVNREVDAHGDEAGHRRREEPAREDAVKRLALDGSGALDDPYA